MKFKLLFVFIFLFMMSCDNKSNDMIGENSETEGGCPLGFDKMMTSNQDESRGNESKDFWPNSLDLDVLRQNSGKSDPMSAEFNYREEFSKLDYEALKKDIELALTDSKDWWPADFGNYGGLFIRMAWHSAGTYRTGDGRGGSRAGQQRFAPLNSWPDNANLDKSRRLLWPIKQKYGQKISWADLMILAGNVAYESMGFETIGFSGGRVDVWEPESDVYWGAETEWLENNKRYDEEGNLEKPLAAVQMGLIYVNPEGPNGNPDPKLAAHNIRETFGRMGMNDEETVALIAGGHTLGKTHGAAPGKYLGQNPEGAGIEQQGLGWESTYKSGKGSDAITSGLEVTWTLTPTEWNHGYFKSLFENEWELVKSPGGAHQFQAVNPEKMYPDAFDENQSHKPTMLVTDLSMIEDPAYRKISKRFYENPKEFEKAFAKAWFKLTHRDMGPKSTYIGPEVPHEDFLWQDPIPEVDYELINGADIEKLKSQILEAGISTGDLVKTAWAAASTYRDSDRKGGANGGRLRLEPQVSWKSNDPDQLKKILEVYENIQNEFNSNAGSKKVSIADLIVLGGNAAIEQAAAKAGYEITVPFNPGRADASQDQTDPESMAVLQPMADGFRNYIKTDYTLSPEQLLVDKAQLLTLTPPEMTVLVGGMRVLDANFNNSEVGVLTDTPGKLNNDFFRNLLSMEYEWKPTTVQRKMFEGYERGTDNKKWTASRIDLIFGSNSELRALAEVYAADDAKEKFVNDFVKAWTKVMNLDRFDLKYVQ